jgi:RNA-binding protein
LKPDSKKFLRAKAHALKPVVITGQAGITPALLNEIGLALDHHELIKVRVNAADREDRRDMAERICRELGAEMVQAIGHIVTLYRRNPEKKQPGRVR